MKNNFFSFLLILTAVYLFACNDSAPGTDGSGTASDANASTENSTSTPDKATAMALWDCGMRAEPGKEGKWVTSISFGESVDLVDTDTVRVEKENRDYVKVKLSDGKSGWVYTYLFVKNGAPGAVKTTASLFKRPDPMTMKDSRLEFGEVIAIGNSQGDWIEVYTEEKGKSGWIKGRSSISTDAIDVAVALMRKKALSEGNPKKRMERIQELMNNTAFENSPFIAGLQEMTEMPEEEVADDELMIMGNNVNVRSEPNTEGDNKLFQLNYGDICLVIDEGQEETIGEHIDKWYKISSGDKEGWIFGSFTSKAR